MLNSNKQNLVLFLLFALLGGKVLAQINQTKNTKVVWLDSLNLETMETGWGQPQPNATINGLSLRLGGKEYSHGVGSHAYSEYSINLHGEAFSFESLVGIDDEVGDYHGSVIFKVFTDGKLAYESGLMKEKEVPKRIEIGLKNIQVLKLVIEDGNDNSSWDHADWAMAKINIPSDSKWVPSPLYQLPSAVPYILTPKASLSPKINTPAVYGARPNGPFLFLLPVTGEEPISYTISNIPPGLRLNKTTGIITGSVSKKGHYYTIVTAKNKIGTQQKKFEIRIGDTIALTPPLGWNSWNCFDLKIDETKIKSAADAFVQKGLSKHGWSYINIDDAWQGNRDSEGNIKSNESFINMKALGEYIHKKGLKFGIYSSPGKKTCGKYEGSGGHEKQDAETYATWGVDYLKYDWCSCNNPSLSSPYRLMDSLLKLTGRDIFYSLCQYGMGDVWKWGESVGGNSWRTSGDINDSWGSLNIGFGQNGIEQYAGPGHWNDPDMMIVGWVTTGLPIHLTRLRPDEQYTHVTLWSLLAAPLLIGCDMTRLDDFTLNLLTNDEVIAVNQDVLGKQGYRIKQQGKKEVWAKPLSDGSYAVAFFNRGFSTEMITLEWSDLQLKGKQEIRDLWRQKDITLIDNHYSSKVVAHGTVFLKITPFKTK